MRLAYLMVTFYDGTVLAYTMAQYCALSPEMNQQVKFTRVVGT